MLSLQVSKERYAAPDGWETIPFFHAVYHPYAILFGNYSSLTMPPYDELWPAEFAPKEPLKLLDRSYSTQFCLEQARAFVWGQQPTIANFTSTQLKTRAAEIDYLLHLALASAWRAPNGQVAVALVSISDQPQQVSLSVPTRDYGLPERTKIVRIDAASTKRIGTTTGGETKVNLQLPSRAAWMLEFRPW
jgi:hypothetical protein